jgi:dTDP-4-amino-4,6-dideoxygalactose transaminase
MSLTGIYRVTELFEEELCRYTGSKYAVAVDHMSLEHEKVKGMEIEVPNRTYPSVPMEVIHAGARVKWKMLPDAQYHISGEYRLAPTIIWDSALRFTSGMYRKGQLQVLSFSGPHKRLKLGKAGAILCDDEETYKWLKRARYSGRGEMSYHTDQFTMLGHNFYLLPQIAALGLLNMASFWNLDGTPKDFEDISLPYPDLSKFKIFTE